MQNDTIETLLQRHYGAAAPLPDELEQRLLANLRRAAEILERQQQASRLAQMRVNRRDAMRLAFRGAGNAGVGLLSTGLSSLQKLEATLNVQDTPVTRPVRS